VIVAVWPIVVRFILRRGVTSKIFLGCYDLEVDASQLFAFDAFVWPVGDGIVPDTRLTHILIVI